MGWQVYVAVTVGSALGGLARYLMANAIPSENFPWGTLMVNILGSFIIGFFATLTGPDGRLFVSTTTRQFVMIGICGQQGFDLHPLPDRQHARQQVAAIGVAQAPIARPHQCCLDVEIAFGIDYQRPRRRDAGDLPLQRAARPHRHRRAHFGCRAALCNRGSVGAAR